MVFNPKGQKPIREGFVRMKILDIPNDLMDNIAVPLKELAIKYNCSLSTVWKWFKKAGLKKEKHRVPPAPPYEQLMAYKDKPYQEVADIFGVSITAVFNWFKIYPIERKKIVSKRPSKEELLAVLHFSNTEIAKMFGVSRQRVDQWIQSEGLSKRERDRAIVPPSKKELEKLLKAYSKEEICQHHLLHLTYKFKNNNLPRWCKAYGLDIKALNRYRIMDKTLVRMQAPNGDILMSHRSKVLGLLKKGYVYAGGTINLVNNKTKQKRQYAPQNKQLNAKLQKALEEGFVFGKKFF